MANSYDIPSWAGKPPTGLHLDVLKDDKLVQKLMVDEKRCYLFGRNSQMNDFCIDHASCSRVHAAFVYHKHLNIAYLVDLGSSRIGKQKVSFHSAIQYGFHCSPRHIYWHIASRGSQAHTATDQQHVSLRCLHTELYTT